MDYYKVGTIVNTQGLQGEVRIISVTDFSEERYQKNAELALFDKADNFVRTLKLKHTANKRILISLNLTAYIALMTLRSFVISHSKSLLKTVLNWIAKMSFTMTILSA